MENGKSNTTGTNPPNELWIYNKYQPLLILLCTNKVKLEPTQKWNLLYMLVCQTVSSCLFPLQKCNHSAMVTNYSVLVKAQAILKIFQSKLYRQEIISKVQKIAGQKEEGLRFKCVLHCTLTMRAWLEVRLTVWAPLGPVWRIFPDRFPCLQIVT